MKRIHLFEFEDLSWFPNFLRKSMTRLMMVMHRLVNTPEEFAQVLAPLLKELRENRITDLCSGSGGPMPEVRTILRESYDCEMDLTLTDLYPNEEVAVEINASSGSVNYTTQSINAIEDMSECEGLLTMVSGFHHMKPEDARQILSSAASNRQAIAIFEISDNSFPKWLWWLAFPINVITCLFVTPLVRPLTWYQLLFTYLIPVLPVFFAWDGAVSNARTYTLKDLDVLLKDLNRNDYQWEKGILKGKTRKIWLIGKPAK